VWASLRTPSLPWPTEVNGTSNLPQISVLLSFFMAPSEHPQSRGLLHNPLGQIGTAVPSLFTENQRATGLLQSHSMCLAEQELDQVHVLLPCVSVRLCPQSIGTS
jgi:hypothetical protein